uniref:Uncharacterized protein n=1 Tax=Arundo donax TaxID=35708 RepID=A0A0A8ZUZ3_ARUDO
MGYRSAVFLHVRAIAR